MGVRQTRGLVLYAAACDAHVSGPAKSQAMKEGRVGVMLELIPCRRHSLWTVSNVGKAWGFSLNMYCSMMRKALDCLSSSTST